MSIKPKLQRVRRTERVARGSLIMAGLLVIWAAGGLATSKVELGSKGRVIFGFTDGPAWLMASAFLCGALVLLLAALPRSSALALSPVTATARWLSVRIGWSLFAAAIVSQTYNALVR